MGSLFAVLAWLAAANAATLDATPEGARQIEDVYAAYFGRAAVDLGVVTTRPEGGSYVVTWDFAKALDAAKAPPGAVNIAPFRYRLTPESSGAWTLESDAFPHMEFDFPAAKGNTHAAFDFDGFQLAGRFDPTSEPFLTSTWKLSAVKGEMSSAESNGPSRVSFVEQGVKVDASATGADGGVDFALTHQVDGVEETIIPGAPEEGGEVKFLSGGVAGRMTGVGLKAHEIGEMWKYVVAHAGDKSAASGFAPLVAAALPLWRDIDAGADLGDLKILSLFGAAEMKRFGEQLSLSGVTEEGRLRFGVDFDDLTLDIAAAPPWAAQLSPASLKIALVLGDSGIGEAARLAVNDPKFGDRRPPAGNPDGDPVGADGGQAQAGSRARSAEDAGHRFDIRGRGGVHQRRAAGASQGHGQFARQGDGGRFRPRPERSEPATGGSRLRLDQGARQDRRGWPA